MVFVALMFSSSSSSSTPVNFVTHLAVLKGGLISGTACHYGSVAFIINYLLFKQLLGFILIPFVGLTPPGR